MMTKKEKTVDMLVLTAEVCGTDLKATAAALMAKDLEHYELDEIEKALTRVRRENKGRLSLAAIIERLEEATGTGVDAAWELAVRARIWDQDVTIVIPTAIIQAFPLALWNTGDKVAARMAFKDAYPRCLDDCGDEVFVSLGWYVEGRRPAIEEAVRSGVITASKANALIGLAPERKLIAKSKPTSIADIANGMDPGS